ncbi:MAG: polysaccharide deacetylase family protein, partial [Clostridia bacterium]|nr:polysaccharide deacetylase family protein [Clostridia bacterium]
LQNHFDEFDSYIIGSSSAASYLPETLETYTEGSYYNLFHYGADIAYDKELVTWLLANDEVRHIVLVLGLSEGDSLFEETSLTDKAHYKVTGGSAWGFYADLLFASPSFAAEKLYSRMHDTEMPQAFDVFLPDDGIYDKRMRDAESIGALDDYLAVNGEDFLPWTEVRELQYVEECASAVAEIRQMCDFAGAELTVILSPVSDAQLQGYTNDSLNTYFTALAQVTEYWNFSISPITCDARYFYDTTHTRNAAADMVLARIYGDEEAYYPDNFGFLCKDGYTVTAEWLKDAAASVEENTYTTNVPILLYHHLDPDAEETGTVLHPETFASHMALLAEHGYTPVSLDQIIAYVEKGEALPDKPVMITFDDGYLSNYEYAFPILQEYGWNAVIFTIGSSVGHYEYYKDTNNSITPHFGQPEIEEMLASGIISIQSHTWDMHQWAPYETGERVRETILPLPGESEDDYIAYLTADIAAQAALLRENGIPQSQALAFPSGKYTRLTDAVLMENGFKVTMTTDSSRRNTLVCGLPQSLVDLGRLNIAGDTTPEAILAYCAGE